MGFIRDEKKHGPSPYVAPRSALQNIVRARIGPCQFRGSAAKMTRNKPRTDHILHSKMRPNRWSWSVSSGSVFMFFGRGPGGLRGPRDVPQGHPSGFRGLRGPPGSPRDPPRTPPTKTMSQKGSIDQSSRGQRWAPRGRKSTIIGPSVEEAHGIPKLPKTFPKTNRDSPKTLPP